jgi:hypothetical protein
MQGRQAQRPPPPSGPDGRRAPPDTLVAMVRPPAVDSAAIDAELLLMIDRLDNATERPTMRRRAQEIHDNTAVPQNLRADAALTMANLYFQEGRQEDVCRWSGKALSLDPRNQTIQQFRRERGCT